MKGGAAKTTVQRFSQNDIRRAGHTAPSAIHARKVACSDTVSRSPLGGMRISRSTPEMKRSNGLRSG
ncbi:hypothetical protein EMGBS8_21180 [Verrucomicrobiota bacterium]|nr:hypothetical protein EMGBS8_21180 [Verrucomicrobiota bacterium]